MGETGGIAARLAAKGSALAAKEAVLAAYRAGLSERGIAERCGFSKNRVAHCLAVLRAEGAIARRSKEEISALMRAAWRPRAGQPDVEQTREEIIATDDAARAAIAEEYPGARWLDCALARVPACLLRGALRLATPAAAAAKMILFEMRDRRPRVFRPERVSFGSAAQACAESAVAGTRLSDMPEIPLAAPR